MVPVDQPWLVEQGVQPWMGERSLPLWLDDPDWFGFNARDSAAARRAGLATRPLAETLADTLAWERTQDPDRVRRAGLTPTDERALAGRLATAEPSGTYFLPWFLTASIDAAAASGSR